MKTLSDDINDYCFFDFETRALPGVLPPDDSVVTAGAYRYARRAFPIILTYAIGDGPVQCVTAAEGSILLWVREPDLPPDLRAFYRRAKQGKAWFVAWNAAFDRLIWNAHYQVLRPEMTLDAMAQAMAANLPARLEDASKAVGGPGKRKGGNALIRLFSAADGATPHTEPEKWSQFTAYAVQDTVALRDVWKKTRPLPPEEWMDYWVSERINDRGVGIDVEFCKKAASVFQHGKAWADDRLVALTSGDVKTLSRIKKLARWVHERLDDAVARAILEKPVEEPDEEETEEGEDCGLTMNRQNVIALRVYLQNKRVRSPMEEVLIKVLELREYGGSSSPAKFAKMAAQADDGRLKGSYRLNGGGQTGRFSSKGIQVHNLPRDTFGEIEGEVCDALVKLDVEHLEAFALKYGPINRTLLRVVRPSLVAPEGKVLVWCDWSNIEARVNPWMSNSRSGEAKLDTFAETDRHPEGPDIYHHTAGRILNIRPEDVTKPQRQSHGKVPELSLGFGGGKGALLRMANTYGVSMSEEDAQRMVDQWREINPWARVFWTRLWEAIQNAMESHLVRFDAGRVSYVYRPDYLDGSLLCSLPNGRILTYPFCKWEKVEDETSGEMRNTLMYRKGYGRSKMWHGKACENVVQGTAGSLLRDKLYRLENAALNVVLHTHDDICVEVAEGRAEATKKALEAIMTEGEQWSEGLPLSAKAQANWFWTKADD